MNNIALILGAVMMIFNFCGSTFAALPQPAPETELVDVQESPVPETVISPAPTERAEPETEPEKPEEVSAEDAAEDESATKAASIFDIMANAEGGEGLSFQVDMAAYYLEDMCEAAASGDVEAGRSAEQNRNAAIDASKLDEQYISFDELYLLARVIFSEAGSDWLTEDFRLCVGEVVLNRVASPEFPDTIHDVVYQKGQYTGVNSMKFALMKPGDDCVAVALKLLQGERRMAPAVVYQSDCIQGELFSMYSDRRLGNTYFCLSSNIELYPIE